MFAKFWSWFQSNRPPESLALDRQGRPVSAEVMEAVVRVLIEIIRSDSEIAAAEARSVTDIVRTHFSATEDLITSLVKQAAEKAQRNESLDGVFSLLNGAYTVEQKVLLLAACWRIVLADGQVERAERRFAVQLRYRFQLTEQQEARAKGLAEVTS